MLNKSTELDMGVAMEMEHKETLKRFIPKATDQEIREIARAIALDHLREDPAYYSHLRSLEKDNATDTASTIKTASAEGH